MLIVFISFLITSILSVEVHVYFRCIYDRKYSLLPELRKSEIKDEGVPVSNGNTSKIVELKLKLLPTILYVFGLNKSCPISKS